MTPMMQRRRALLGSNHADESPIIVSTFVSPDLSTDATSTTLSFADAYFNQGNGFYYAKIVGNTLTKNTGAVKAWKSNMSVGSGGALFVRNDGFRGEGSTFSFTISEGATIIIKFWPEISMED